MSFPEYLLCEPECSYLGCKFMCYLVIPNFPTCPFMLYFSSLALIPPPLHATEFLTISESTEGMQAVGNPRAACWPLGAWYGKGAASWLNSALCGFPDAKPMGREQKQPRASSLQWLRSASPGSKLWGRDLHAGALLERTLLNGDFERVREAGFVRGRPWSVMQLQQRPQLSPEGDLELG